MKFLRLSSLLVLVLANQLSYAAERLFTPIKADGQIVEDNYGVSFVSQRGKAIDITLGYIPDTSTTGWLQIFVRNNGWQDVYFSEQSISLVTKAGADLKVFTYDEQTSDTREQLAEESKKASRRKIGLGLLVFLGSSAPLDAGYTTTTSKVDGRVTNQYGQSRDYNATIESRTYDPAAAEAARQAASEENARRNAAIMARERQRHEEAVNLINQQTESKTRGLLKSGTIESGQTLSGKIRISLPDQSLGNNEMLVKIRFPSELFEIKYQE